jgi:hypothetical protein
MANAFSVKITFKNRAAFDAQAAKVADATPLFEAVRDRWRHHNVDKFEASRGAESAGVQFADGTFWQPVTDNYYAEKRRAGYADWLMVRTGELRSSLTDDSDMAWREFIGKTEAAFGSVDRKVEFHAVRRPVQFLDEWDQGMIVDMVKSWLEDSPPFARYTGGEDERMDAEFEQMFSGASFPIGSPGPDEGFPL